MPSQASLFLKVRLKKKKKSIQFLPGSLFGDIYAWTSHHVVRNPGHRERLCVGVPASNLAQVSGDSINCEGVNHLKMQCKSSSHPADSSECVRRQHGLPCPVQISDT